MVLGSAVLLGPEPEGVPGPAFARRADEPDDTQLVLRGEHAEVLYPPRGELTAQHVLMVAERAWKRHSALLGVDERGSFVVILPGEEREFAALTRGVVPDWGVGVAVPDENLIVLRPPRGVREAVGRDEVVAHEVAHLVTARATGGVRLPAWMEEGLAVFLSRRWTLRQRAELYWNVAGGRLPPLAELEGGFPRDPDEARRAYLKAYTLVDFLSEELGAGGLPLLMSLIREERSLEGALVRAGDWDLERLEWEWQRNVTGRYRPVALLGQSLPLWGLVVLLAMVAFWRRRLRAARIKSKWLEEGDEDLAG